MNRFTAAAVLALVVVASPIRGQEPARPLDPKTTAIIDVLDVGQGDSILIRSPEGKSALIDAGPSAAVVSKLRALGVTSLDLVSVSHHHQDHYGGMGEESEFYDGSQKLLIAGLVFPHERIRDNDSPLFAEDDDRDPEAATLTPAGEPPSYLKDFATLFRRSHRPDRSAHCVGAVTVREVVAE